MAPDAPVADVRRFNRVVTQRVGALDDRFLARDRPLGEARLLWEIGEDGCEVRLLRSRLGLDSGYLSRLLRSLEDSGLARVGPGERDGRTRTARLTAQGRREWTELDRRSDRLALSFLAPLNDKQRGRLVAAMNEVERLLTAGTVEIAPLHPAHPHARYCVGEYFAEIDRRFEAGFDPEASLPAGDAELSPPAGVMLVATLRSKPVGCGALKFHPRRATEIKRMWVAPSARGLGVGRRLLAELEATAAARGDRLIRLDTNDALSEAIGMYHSACYTEVEAFNEEPYAHHWFEKRLPAA